VGSGKMLVVAAKNLKPGTVLQAVDVKTIPFPGEQLPRGTYGSVDQVVGSTVFDTINEQELVLESKLASTQSGGGAGVPAGMRAVSVHVTDSTGVLALLHAGQKVDVQVVLARQNGEVSVRTAIEDLRILSITPTPEVTSQGHTLPVVTLLAKPAEADILALGDAGARVRLTLRNPLDEEMRAGSALTLGTVMKGGGPAADGKRKGGNIQKIEKPASGSTK
jgi:pilus assembly protein CpaB